MNRQTAFSPPMLEGEGKRKGEDGDENVNHAFLGVVGANLYHFLALLSVGLLGRVGIKLDIGLDIFHCAVGTRGDSLHRCASEPEDDAAAKDESYDAVGVQQVKDAGRLNAEGLLYKQDEGEYHGGGTHDGSAN